MEDFQLSPALLKILEPVRSFPPSHRDLLPRRDYDESLVALATLIEQASAIEQRHEDRIREAGAAIEGARSVAAEDCAIEAQAGEMHHLVFLNAVLGHACVGGLAPFFEGIFKTLLTTLKTRLRGRCARLDRWDRRTKPFVETIYLTLSDVGVVDCLEPELRNVLDALFEFRNAGLHNGVEWPDDVRDKFFATVGTRGWGSWFEWSTSSGEPWVVSPTTTFFRACHEQGALLLQSIARMSERVMGLLNSSAPGGAS